MSTQRLRFAAAIALAVFAAGCGDGDERTPRALEIVAHRGGPIASVDGEATAAYPENSMSAFKAAHAAGFSIELDVNVTRDGVPVVIHDETLERTTDCQGEVVERAARALARCRLDVLGTGGVTAPNREREPVPTLAGVLEWGRAEGAAIVIDLKRVSAHAVVEALERSGIPHERVRVQSFSKSKLDAVRQAGWRTALLTVLEENAGAPAAADRHGFDVLSPEWPLPGGFLAGADRPVVPWTLDRRRQIRAAVRAGVDGIITDDPRKARALADR